MREIVAEAVANSPNLTAGYVESMELYRDPEVKQTLIERLMRAGLPESAPQPALAASFNT